MYYRTAVTAAEETKSTFESLLQYIIKGKQWVVDKFLYILI